VPQFRFSPRPNRAAEIPWEPWGAAAFARAEREAKPILLAISAVWCHWCHVMDETTYSDSGVIASIAERFVPVRVDNDERPDINARYNMGGWPTTAFLASDGATLTGATYLPPQEMLRVLEEIARWYRDNAAEIAARSTEIRARQAPHVEASSEDLDPTRVSALAESIARTFDERYAGFGDAPKFPQPEMLDFLFGEYLTTGDERVSDMVVRTVAAMAQGGMYDHVEGGFFRYSTTRDWSVPHFEKMAEDHAGLIRVLTHVVTRYPQHELRATLRSAVDYTLNVLRDPETGFFAGSQDADEEYYALSLLERRARDAPYVDRTVYADRNAALAGALALAGVALEDDAVTLCGLAALDALQVRMLEDGLLFHVQREGDRPVCGLLGDQAAYLRALLDAHQATNDERFVERAVALVGAMERRLAAPGGGYFDRAPAEEQLGRLALQDRPIAENGIVAEALLRLFALRADDRYRTIAKRILLIYANTFARAGGFAATYARALRRYFSPAQDGRTNAFQYQQPQNPVNIE
jgi:uncharacterized protein YyaL (SSP411 family)